MVRNFCDLSGKNAVVVGGSGGIGQAIAQGFCEAGANVIIASKNPSSLSRAAGEIKLACGADVPALTVDASSESEVEELLQRCLGIYSKIDILVNAQGINRKFPGTEFPEGIWDAMFDANVKSVMLTCKHFGKYMMENQIHGKIINMSSVRGIRAVGNGGNGNIGYCATKGAVEMLTKAYASDLRPNIQVNAIGPMVTYTPKMIGVLPFDPAERNIRASATPAMRIGDPQDCVGPAVFLASAASDFITGTTLYPDGGLTSIG